jgi:hypothetical protein
MDDYIHTDLLVLQSAELTGRTPFCPEDQEIAAYFDGRIADAERQTMERHLADCRFCLARIGMLNRQQEEGGTQRVPEEMLASAKRLSNTAPARRFKRAPAWATAAVVVISVFLVMNSRQVSAPSPGTGPAEEIRSGEYSRQLRNMDRSAMSLDVLTPTLGGAVTPGSLIRWTEIPDNIHYNIFVLSNAGDVLWTERLQSTEWILQQSLNLATGSEYFFRIEAVLPDGGTVSSKHLAFRVAERE